MISASIAVSQELNHEDFLSFLIKHKNLPLTDQFMEKAKLNFITSNLLPRIYLIGFPKCGTTTIAEALFEHPSLEFPEIKPNDPNYFKKEAHFFDCPRYESGLLFYSEYYPKLRHLSGNDSVLHSLNEEVSDHDSHAKAKHKITGIDGTPSIMNLIAFVRMSSVFSNQSSNIRFIVSLRDPFEAIYSAWNHLRKSSDAMNYYGNSSDFYADVYLDFQSQKVSSCHPTSLWWLHHNRFSLDKLMANFFLNCPPIIRNYLFPVVLEIWNIKFSLRNFCFVFLDEMSGTLDEVNSVWVGLQKCLQLPIILNALYRKKTDLTPRNKASLNYKNYSDYRILELKRDADFFFRPWLCVLRTQLLRSDKPCVVNLTCTQRMSQRMNRVPWMPNHTECAQWRTGLKV
jgi:hypothetical protein